MDLFELGLQVSLLFQFTLQLTVLPFKFFDFLFQAVNLGALKHGAASIDTDFLLAFLMLLTDILQVAVGLEEKVPRLDFLGLARRAIRFITTHLGMVEINFSA